MLDAARAHKAMDGLNLRWSVSLNTAVPFMLYGIILGRGPSDAMMMVPCVLFGLAGYSLAEYGFHRWVLHGLVTVDHRRHHREPFALMAMPFATGLSAHTGMLLVLSMVIGLDGALPIVLGSAIGYAIYGQLHELIHRDPGLAHRLIPRLYRHHMLHHHVGTAGEDRNFGVLTTVWDHVFGTIAHHDAKRCLQEH